MAQKATDRGGTIRDAHEKLLAPDGWTLPGLESRHLGSQY